LKKDPRTVLREYFKIPSFRLGQEDIIRTILEGEDVLGIMPTGAGKSICYQVPALIFEGVSIVISPLIALMKDQVDALQALKIPATFINSALSLGETQQRIDDVRNGFYKLLYIAPERFYSAAFMKLINQIDVSFIAIDEAHCISQWGHDFRPSYLKLKNIIRQIGDPPVAAFTATATKEVREDILIQLDRPKAKVFISGFDRPNLKYFAATLSNEEKNTEMLRIIPTIKGSGIVYVSTQKAVDTITALLNTNGIKAIGYHGGMDKVKRHETQDKWLSNEAPVIVATNAFGMGIDKYDVRFVLHYNMPGSLEAYYQEAGRAGRDGKTSYCILFYNFGDRKLQEFFIENNYPPQETLETIYNFLFDLDREEIYLTYREIGENCGINEMSVGSSIKLFEQYGILQRMNKQTMTFQADFILDKKKSLKKAGRSDIQKKVVEWLLPYDGEPVPLEKILEEVKLTQEQFSYAMRELGHKEVLIYTPPFRGRGILITSKRVPWERIGIDFKIYEERMGRQFEKLDLLEQYIEKRICRRKFLLEYFGDKYPKSNCHGCDICLNWHPQTKHNEADPKEGVSGNKALILECIDEFNGTYGVTTIAKLLNGSDHERFRKIGLLKNHFFGRLENVPLKKIIATIYQLIREERIIKSAGEYPVLSINADFKEQKKTTRREKPRREKVTDFSNNHNYSKELFSLLKKLRLKLAGELPPYFIFSDDVLKNICVYLPTTQRELLSIKGIGKKKADKYGQIFLDAVSGYINKNPKLKESAPLLDSPVKKATNASKRTSVSKIKSHIQTYNYFHGGFSINEIADMRAIGKDQIIRHLIKCINEGYDVDLNRILLPHKQQTILDTAKMLNTESLKEIKEYLPESYSYDEIKLTLAKTRRK
jgi:ATP-dependent DNA helicase RecQ